MNEEIRYVIECEQTLLKHASLTSVDKVERVLLYTGR